MDNRMPGDADDGHGKAAPAADDGHATAPPAADDGHATAAIAAGILPGRRLVAVLLLTAAAVDLARCGLVLAVARPLAPAAGLAAVGLAAAVVSVGTARGCRAGQRWARWAALLIGAGSAPQAAMSSFHGPSTIPDTATAVLGVIVTIAVLATAGPAGQPGIVTDNPCLMAGSARTAGGAGGSEAPATAVAPGADGAAQ